LNKNKFKKIIIYLYQNTRLGEMQLGEMQFGEIQLSHYILHKCLKDYNSVEYLYHQIEYIYTDT